MVDEYVSRVTRRYERGHVSKLHQKHSKYIAPRLVEWLGNPKLRDITKKMAEDFIDARIATGMAPRTVKNYTKVLSAILKQAVDDGMIMVNPVKNVEMPKSDSPVHILTPDELSKLLSLAPQVFKKHDMITPRLMFGAFGGLRTSEIERLTWEDVRLDVGQLYVSSGKTKNAERWVVLTPPLLDYCEKMLGDGATGLVLRGAISNRTPCAIVVTRHKKMLCKAAGVNIPSNALRHSYGSHHLVHYDNAGNTATEMSHYSAQMTFAAYRGAVYQGTSCCVLGYSGGNVGGTLLLRNLTKTGLSGVALGGLDLKGGHHFEHTNT